MIKRIVIHKAEEFLDEAAEVFRKGKKAVALSGAGISVESGIPDFRSPGGLWTVYPPDEYATLDAFLETPEKAWKLYRAIGRTLRCKEPNAAHKALAFLEAEGFLAGVITHNIDALHQKAGSRCVVEVHGEHQHLQCLGCGSLVPVDLSFFEEEGDIPQCETCARFLKPNVVLFSEAVRGMQEVDALLQDCDRLLVVGTSAQVYPVAGFPAMVEAQGGILFEFNLEETPLTRGEPGGHSLLNLLWQPPESRGKQEHYFFQGKAGEALSRFVERVVA